MGLFDDLPILGPSEVVFGLEHMVESRLKQTKDPTEWSVLLKWVGYTNTRVLVEGICHGRLEGVMAGKGSFLEPDEIASDEIVAKIIEAQRGNLDFLVDELMWFLGAVEGDPVCSEMSRDEYRAWLEYGFEHLADLYRGEPVDPSRWVADMAASWLGGGYRSIESSLHGTLVFLHLLVPIVRNAFAGNPSQQLEAVETVLDAYRKDVQGHLDAYSALVREVCESARGSRAEHADSVRFDELLVAKAGGAPADPGVPLTAREAEVLHLVGLGYENGEISSRLNLSQNTVKGHIRTLLMKTALHNRTQLALYAVTRGFCSQSEVSTALRDTQESGGLAV